MIRISVAIGLALACVTASALAEDKDKAKKDGSTLVGNYLITGAEEDGQKAPPEKYEGAIVEVTKDRMLVVDKNKKQIYVCTYQLDTTKTPWGVTMTAEIPNKGEMARGMIEQKGDTVRLIYALSGAAPTKFKTEAKGQIMVEMKKQKEK